MLIPTPSRLVGSALSTAERTLTALAERAIDAAMRGPLVEAAARDLVRYHVIERATAELAEGDQLEEFVTRALDTPAARRMVASVIDSAVVDEAVTRLLASDELWLLVDEVARSPSVTEAISHQGAGLADQVAGVVRERSRVADARLERVARRLIGRNGG